MGTSWANDKNVHDKNTYQSSNDYPFLAAKQSCKVSTVAGVPVKYGKCVPAKYSVKVPESTVPLNNRFQCLQNLCDSQDDIVHEGIHVCTGVYGKGGHSVPNNNFRVPTCEQQHLVECKPSPSCSHDVLQPMLAVRANYSLQGNKNKTGFLAGDSINMEEQKNGSSQTLHNDVAQIKTFDAKNNHQLYDGNLNASDLHIKSQLTSFQIGTLAGNKNGNGLSDGLQVQVRSLSPKHHTHEVNITAGACAQVTTDNLDTLFDQNYDPNILPTVEGDVTVPQSQKILVNSINNEPHTFGFCPLTPLDLYTGKSVTWEVCPTDLEAHAIITATGKPNYMAARIQVASQLKIDNWRLHLSDYWDVQLPDLLQYGYPLDVDRGIGFESTETNHTSALQNVQHVHSYIQEELDFQAMLGPFQAKPISLHVSPLMVRDKQDSMKKRTIMDLSWPKGASVNAAVQKDIYLGTQYMLTYPSIDSITNSLVKLGPAALIYKVDISRAFRQIKIDPRDIDLLGLKFQNQYFIDRSVPFGYRNGSQIFQRCTDAIRFTMQQHGFPHLFNYIDDLIYTGLPSNINDSFQFLLKLLQELGLDISQKKLVPPSTSVVCLGIHINTVDRTLSIPDNKLAEIVNICKSWVSKTYCSKKQLQSLLGSLLYVS